MTTLTLVLTPEVHSALEREAATHNLGASDRATRLIEDYLAEKKLLTKEVADEIVLARSLIDRAIIAALRIVEEEGLKPSVTFDTLQALTADPEWLRDYAKLICDDPFKTGVSRKKNINQNLGYFIKKALGADSLRGPDNRPVNVKVNASIIQSYTPLAPKREI